MNKKLIVLTASILMAGIGIAHAEETPKLDNREAHQQHRIEQGVKSGELTRRETIRLEKGQAKLRAQEAAAKADGDVTKEERKALHKSANHQSKRIFRQKHDAQDRK